MPTATLAHTHSPRALFFAETFASLSVADMIGVQRVYVEDYQHSLEDGNKATAQRILERNVNPLGEAIDMRDGTCRECASVR